MTNALPLNVDTTAAIVAVARLKASLEPDPLVFDPFVLQLLGKEGLALTRTFYKTGSLAESHLNQYMAFRSRFGDETALTPGIQQVVILASGLDTRAWRLPFGPEVTVYEVDRSDLFRAKRQRLPATLCKHVCVQADLTKDPWDELLLENGLDPLKRTAWLLEGLIMYLEPADIQLVFKSIDRLSQTNGSRLFFDQVGDVHPGCQFKPLFTSNSFLEQLPQDVACLKGWEIQEVTCTEPGFERFGKLLPAHNDDAGKPILPTFLVQVAKRNKIELQ